MKNFLILYLKGFAMGAADVVPGVSGGTIAFISGIYETLLYSLASLPAALKLLCKGSFSSAFKQANASFLLVLLAGIASSILTLAQLVNYLLVYRAIAVWSFFLGLVLVSAFIMVRSISSWRWAQIVAIFLGLFLGYYLTVLSPVQWPHDNFHIFLAGMIALCAMILPGVSGSFLLLVMGLYTHIVQAISSFDIILLSIFSLGGLCGLLLFSKLLSFFLLRGRNTVLALLIGLMLGSLNKLWPWKETLSWGTNSHNQPIALLQQNILPNHFGQLYHTDPQVLNAVIWLFVGIITVLAIEWLAKSKKY